MASSAADLLLVVQKAQAAVSDLVMIKHRGLIDVSSSPRRTIDEITEKSRWFSKHGVVCRDTWCHAIQVTTLFEINVILMLSALEKDMKDLKTEVLRWTQGEFQAETASLLREAVIEDLMHITNRAGGYLLMLHCSRTGEGADAQAQKAADWSEDCNSPHDSDTAVITHLKSLRGDHELPPQASITKAVQFFARNPSLDDEFNSCLQSYLAPLKLFKHLCDTLIEPLKAWPFHRCPADISCCKSSVCQYLKMGPASLGPDSSEPSEIEAAWMAYENADGTTKARNEYDLWKMTWQLAFTAIEKQHTAGSSRPYPTRNALRTFFEYHALFAEDRTPKRRSRAQVIAMGRARRNPDLPTPTKPKATSSKEASTSEAAEGALAQIMNTMPKCKPDAASSSGACANDRRQSRSHLNWGWTDSYHTNKPSQFEEETTSTPRAEPKQKTRGIADPALVEEAAPEPEEDDADTPSAEPLIFTDPTLYSWIREIFPLSSALRLQDSLPDPTGRIRFTDVRRLLRSPPLNFREIHIGMPECKWKTPCGKWFIFHTPHKKHGGWIEAKLLQNLPGQLKRLCGWTGEEFVLDESAGKDDDE